MNRKSKIRITNRGLRRYLKSQGLHKNIKDMEQDIKAVNGVLVQLESKRDNVKDFYGVGYKIIHAQTQGLLLLEKSLEDKLVEKNKLCIPLSFLRDITQHEEPILTEGMAINLIKTHLNKEAKEDVITACKDILSMELYCYGTLSHRQADEVASNIVDTHFGGSSVINTRRNREHKYKKATYGGYLRNQSRPEIDPNEDD